MARTPAHLGAALTLVGLTALAGCAVAPFPAAPPTRAAGSSAGNGAGSASATPDPSTSGSASTSAAPTADASSAPASPGTDLHPAQGAPVDATRLMQTVGAATRAEKFFRVSFDEQGTLVVGTIDRSEPSHVRAEFSAREKSDVTMRRMRMIYVDGPDLYVEVTPHTARFRKVKLTAAPAQMRHALALLEDPVALITWHPAPGEVVRYGGNQAGDLRRYVAGSTPGPTGGPAATSSELWTDAQMRIYLVQDFTSGTPRRSLHVSQYGTDPEIRMPAPSLVVS